MLKESTEGVIHLVPDPSSTQEEEQLEFEELLHCEEPIPENPFLSQDSDLKKEPRYRSSHQAGAEIIEGSLDPACWLEAMKAASGNEARAKVIYAQWRQEVLEKEHQLKSDKEAALELRRMACFVPITRLPSLEKKEIKIGLFWGMVIVFSTLGVSLSISRIFPSMGIGISILLSLVFSMSYLWGVKSLGESLIKEEKSVNLTSVVSLCSVVLAAVSLLVTLGIERFALYVTLLLK